MHFRSFYLLFHLLLRGKCIKSQYFWHRVSQWRQGPHWEDLWWWQWPQTGLINKLCNSGKRKRISQSQWATQMEALTLRTLLWDTLNMVNPRRLKCHPWAQTALISNKVENQVSLQNVFREIWVKSRVTSSEVFVWHSCCGCQSERHHQVKGYSWLLRSECGFCSHLPPSGCTQVLKKRLPSSPSCFCTTEHQEATAVKNKKNF